MGVHCSNFLSQEVNNTLYAEVDLLLTLEQYQQLVPETQACYVPYGTFIVFERLPIPISDIISEGQKPLSLLKWDSSGRTLQQLSREVSVLLQSS